MKGQLMLISGIVAGLILISTASTISSIQSEKFNPKSISQDISVIKLEAESLNLEKPEDRTKFRRFVDSFPGYASDLNYWSSQKCFNVTLRRKSDLYNIECVGKEAIAPKTVILELTSINDFSNKGSFNATSASRADLSGKLGLGYRNGSSGDELVGFWRLDTADSTVLDYSGTDNDGSNNGASRGATGTFGTNAFEFENEADHVKVDGPIPADGGSEVTISAWVNSESTSVDAAILGNEISAGTDQVTGFRYDQEGYQSGENNGIKFSVKTDSGSSASETVSNVQTTDWQHIVLRWTEGQAPDLFIDGSEVSTSYSGGSLSGNLDLSNMYIGTGPKAESGNWSGTIDEVQVYDQYFSEDEIQNLYFYGLSGQYLGEYETNIVDVPSGRNVTDIEVRSTVPTTGTDVQVTAEHISSGKTDKVNLDSGFNHENYSLSIPEEGSVQLKINKESSNVEQTPVIDELRLWASE